MSERGGKHQGLPTSTNLSYDIKKFEGDTLRHLKIKMKSQCNLCAKILFTLHTSIEFHSHGDMSVPSPWVNSDYVSFDIRVEAVMDNTVLIPVPRKILKKNGLRLISL